MVSISYFQYINDLIKPSENFQTHNTLFLCLSNRLGVKVGQWAQAGSTMLIFNVSSSVLVLRLWIMILIPIYLLVKGIKRH